MTTEMCDKCNGYGTDENDWDDWCDEFDGTGEVEVEYNDYDD